jgi:hypothetical protein
MMPTVPEPAACRAFFGDARRTLTPLPTSGFSGSRIFLVEEYVPTAAASARWVVKSFGPGTSIDRAIWVHGLMTHMRRGGIEGIPMLRRAVVGRRASESCLVTETLAEDADGVLWEAAEFLAGRAVAVPDAVARGAALRRLAAIHVAAATLPDGLPRRSRSHGLSERVDRAAVLRERPWEGRWRGGKGRAARSRWGEAIATSFEQAIVVFAEGGPVALERITHAPLIDVPCQAVLRDIWSDHVLFEGGRVSGIIDFHAAGIDTVATDIARLVGSWSLSAGVAAAWGECLDAYESVRSLDDEERRLVTFLHHAGVIVAIDNWFRWLIEEERTFADRDAVANRLGQLVLALPESIAALLRR